MPPPEVRFKDVPSQIGELLPAFTTGNGFTVTFIVAVLWQLLASVMLNVYVPLAAVVAPAMLGFCWFDVNTFGPLQL